MPDETGIETESTDAGAAAEKGASEVGDTSRPEPISYGDLKSTVEFAKPAASEKTVNIETPLETQTKGAGKEEVLEPDKTKTIQEPVVEKETRGEKRIKQLVERAKDAEERYAQLEARFARLEQGGGKTEELPNVLELENNDILERLNENPKGFMSDLTRQIRTELMDDLNRTQSQNHTEAQMRRAMKTFEDFGSKHSDFDEMWDDGHGPIGEFMEQNPGHNAISAYHEITAENRIKAAVEDSKKALTAQFEKDKKKAVDDTIANIRAGAVVDMDGGGAGSKGISSPEQGSWKTSDYGGDKTRGLLDRLNQRTGAK